MRPQHEAMPARLGERRPPRTCHPAELARWPPADFLERRRGWKRRTPMPGERRAASRLTPSEHRRHRGMANPTSRHQALTHGQPKSRHAHSSSAKEATVIDAEEYAER